MAPVAFRPLVRTWPALGCAGGSAAGHDGMPSSCANGSPATLGPFPSRAATGHGFTSGHQPHNPDGSPGTRQAATPSFRSAQARAKPARLAVMSRRDRDTDRDLRAPMYNGIPATSTASRAPSGSMDRSNTGPV